MNALVLDEINKNDVSEAITLMTESYNVNSPFSSLGEWTKEDSLLYRQHHFHDYLVAS
jgi:hypothetical protein